ncbi:FkbM family methyltransferase [Pseudovibrio sp. Tun.PSC04-5.I4]|uniref:FkbM family methyltransferase n=1 Tax=Pseudovibrio sp. Tun.PSC04-5.I4 TaxID=1798213 RepID=UPI00087EC5C0|nr:FkbM family methyltransferase [Pseudovibrio sp. Tun.PSC04-5.I4]SDQ15901.1 Methyltransferase FkbM domain-containing protein [Pseudovibrio sp. Tun.PSC04-5.I4]
MVQLLKNYLKPKEKPESSVSFEQLDSMEKRVQSLEAKARLFKPNSMSKAAQEMVTTIFRLISPMDPKGLAFERVGRDFDGGYVQVKLPRQGSIAYSVGIKRDVSWDLDMANRGYQIFQYDHTISVLPQDHPNFNWVKLGITGQSEMTKELSSLPKELHKNNHLDIDDIVLKMDIEGHEWSVFGDIEPEDLCCFSQIMLEIHSLHQLHTLAQYRRARKALSKLHKTHQVVHVHGNNNTSLTIIGGTPVPPVMELTLVRRDLCEFETCSRTFPTELDQPNNPNYAEHILGSFRY